MTDIRVIGGGIAGLVAAIECAEGGASVTLQEATRKLGGRARSLDRDGFVTNHGPHAFYLGGPATEWLEPRDLMPPLVMLKPTKVRVRYDGRIRALPIRFLRAASRLGGQAPATTSFAEWARTRVPPRTARLVEGSLTLPLYDGDPGRHAAASVQSVAERTRRRGVVAYVEGGWGRLVDRLAERASDLGVEIHLGSRVDRMESGPPTIVCLSPRAAGRLLGEEGWGESQQVALRDLGLRHSRRGPAGLLDLDLGVYVARYSDLDPSLAPAGHDLLQCCAGLRPGEEPAAAQRRIEEVLDAGYPGWRSRAVTDHSSVSISPGVRDAVGRDWRGRPAIDRGEGILLAGDWVAAPGFLAEIAYASASTAARRALELSSRRSVGSAGRGV